MVRRIILVVFLILIGIGVWIFFRISAIDQAERDVSTRFDAVVSFYVNIRPQYLEPLLNISDGTESNRKDLTSLADHLEALGKIADADERHEKLIAVQREMNAIFQGASLSATITSDRHFIEWNKEASSRGHASKLLYEYNMALAAYNAVKKSTIGRLMDFWPHWNHHEFLSVDGTTQAETTIHF